MAANRLILIEAVRDLGKPGLAGALLLLGGLAYALAVVLPAQKELESTRARLAKAEVLAARIASGQEAAPSTPESRRAAFYGNLPPEEAITQWVQRIYDAAANHQLALARGEYAQAEISDTRLVRYRIVLPLKGDYGRIRRFVSTLQTEIPGLGLDDISLQRETIGDTEVEARIQFSLYLAKR